MRGSWGRLRKGQFDGTNYYIEHAYRSAEGPTRCLIILTTRLRDLIAELHDAPREQHNAIMRRLDSEIFE